MNALLNSLPRFLGGSGGFDLIMMGIAMEYMVL
jgi:hypothetical protein